MNAVHIPRHNPLLVGKLTEAELDARRAERFPHTVPVVFPAAAPANDEPLSDDEIEAKYRAAIALAEQPEHDFDQAREQQLDDVGAGVWRWGLGLVAGLVAIGLAKVLL